MTQDMLLTLGILTVAIILFITEWLRVDVVALGVVVSLMLTGILTTAEALSGFSSSAVLTIAALFVVGGAVMQTGLAGAIGRRILTVAGDSPNRLILVIMLTVAVLSGFMSDTGTVAVLLPAIISLAWNAKISPSKLLIPLSFGALLGGAMTLIGTPPNIIVSDLLRENGLTPFQFFDYTPIGLILLAAGILYILLVGLRLLPDHQPKQEIQRVETPDELAKHYQLPDNIFRLRVRRSSSVVGKSILESEFRDRFKLNILEILRDSDAREVAKLGARRLVLQSEPQSIPFEPDTTLSNKDLLIVQGEANDVSHAAASLNLGLQPAQAEGHQALVNHEIGLAEVLLPPRSTLVGKTIVETRFGTLLKLTVLGIRRPGTDEELDLKTTPLRFGDSLLVQGPWENILALRLRRRDFVVMGQPEEMIGAPARRKAPIALAILLGMLLLLVTNALPVAAASMLAGLAMILTGCLDIDDAYAAVDWKSIVLIAGMLPMSIALEKVGLVEMVASGLTDALGMMSPLVVMASLFMLTSIFTQVLSNTATTVLVAPIALATAQNLGLQPYAFLMAVAIAASMAFASPVASPTNTLVMGAGNYKFSDYIKVGLPLILLAMLITVLVLPLLWTLQ
ncbi:MAG: SLC13 family permease [Anaerolineales bacterium]|nr:SLC13 family permease [Anaerolineales bacterium]